MRKLLVATVLCLFVTTSQADLLDDATAAYEKGEYTLALRLYRPLAEAGDSALQFILGTMYWRGKGTLEDHAEAFKWFRLSAEQGYADSQYMLGIMYSQGRAIPQDRAEAFKWYRLSAEQGQADSQYRLSLMYQLGLSAPQDFVLAHKWANLAASRATGEETRDKATQTRDKLAARMTLAQVAEAQKLAREWDKAYPR